MIILYGAISLAFVLLCSITLRRGDYEDRIGNKRSARWLLTAAILSGLAALLFSWLLFAATHEIRLVP